MIIFSMVLTLYVIYSELRHRILLEGVRRALSGKLGVMSFREAWNRGFLRRWI